MATSKHTWCSAAKRTAKEIETYEAKVMKGINEDEVLREWNELNRHREETMGSTRKKIGILRNNFDELRAMLKDTTLQNSNKNFPHLLETFENKLSSFKLTMRTDYDYLEQAERGLAKDIIQLASSMEDWYIEDHNKSFHEEMLQQQRERHQERQNTDIERKAIIGSIDRKVRKSYY